MTVQEKVDEIAERLRAVAEAAPTLAIAEKARRLEARLSTPVRVVLLGLPDARKLELLNALAGGTPLPDAAREVTVELLYGKAERARITRSDGSVAEIDGTPGAEDLADAALVVIERPTPVLRRTSFLNLVASADREEQHSAIAWAARRTDIAAWCSANFGRDDRLIWAEVPERVRDHGYLVLTGCGAEEASIIKARHRDEFLDVYAVNPDLEAAVSGIGELAGRIAYDAELGQRADTDSALLFLKTQAPRPRTRPRPNSRPLTQPRVMTRPRTEPVEIAPPPAPAPAPVAVPEPAAVPVARAKPAGSPALCGSGFGYLRDRGQALLGGVAGGAAFSDDAVLAHCSETLTHLTDLVTGHEDSESAGDLADMVLEAESLVILLENEGGAEAAVDAVSILLQIRREFEVGLAA